VGPAIQVETIEAGGLWSTLVDANQLENALLNLCINARDAMPDGGRITIETSNRWLDDRTAREHALEPGQYVTVCVSDTGVGIEKDILERVFDPFFTTKPLGEGTGLGLSMVYGFARQSHGHIRIYSEVGKGTMVCLYLPRHDREDETTETRSHHEPELDASDARILVVDDEPTVRMLITESLSDLGHVCIEAGDGPQALAILQSGSPIDLLITDVGLPGGLNGRQVADAARKLRPDLRVLFVTGYAENAALNHGHIERGMEVLTKPFVVKELMRRVSRLLNGGA
jgi:CheY-like chemotaxis protein